MRTANRLGRLGLLICLLPPPSTQEVAGERLADLLSYSPDAPPDAGDLAARLRPLGLGAVPSAFGLLDSAVLPGPEERPLDPLQTEAIQLYLASFGRAGVIGELERRWADSAKPLTPTLAVFARVAEGDDVGLLMDHVERRPPQGITERRAFEHAFTAVAARAEAALTEYERLLIWTPKEQACDLVRALSAVGRGEEALELFAGLLGRREELDRVLLQAIGAIGPGVPRPADERSLERVRGFLSERESSDVRVAAIRAAGSLDDFEVVPELIAWLEHEEEPIREASSGALELIACRRFGLDPARWSTWLAAEGSWYRESLPDLIRELDSGDPASVGRALNDICQRTYRRHELALEVTRLLEDPVPDTRREACLALERLGSPASVEALVPLLEDPDLAVAEAARSALHRITGSEVSPERDGRWSDAESLR